MLGIFCKDAQGGQTQPHQLVLWTSLPMACGRGAHLRSVWTGRLKLRTEDQRTERGHIREHKRGILFRWSVCVVVGGKRQDSVQAGWQVCWCEMGMTTTQTMCPSEPALHSELRRGRRQTWRQAGKYLGGGLLVALPQEASRSVPVSVLIGLAVRRATGELASSTVSSAVLFLLNPGREVLSCARRRWSTQSPAFALGPRLCVVSALRLPNQIAQLEAVATLVRLEIAMSVGSWLLRN